MKPFILISGMHRSGTSFLSRALNLSGVYLGDISKLSTNDWVYGTDNLRGHWENKDLTDLSDKTFHENNGTWDSVPSKINCSKEITMLVKKHTDKLLTHPSLASGFKDPRLLICLESWNNYLPKNSIIYGIFRNPLKVAESLKIRNGFSYEKSLNLWEIYNKKLLSHLKSYDGFLLDFDWDNDHLFTEINKINKKLGLLQTDFSDWFSQDLLHSDKTFQSDFKLPSNIIDLYDQLKERSLKNSDHIFKFSVEHSTEDLHQILSSTVNDIKNQGSYFRELNEENLKLIENISNQNLELQKINIKNSKLLGEKIIETNNLSQAIENYQNIITEIHQSFVFRALHKYDKTLGKILPLRPKKYSKSVTAYKSKKETEIIVNDAIQKFEKKDIICFPIINWDFRTQRPQHIITEFANNGHRIFYFKTNLRKLQNPYEIEILSENIFEVELDSLEFFDIYKDKFNEKNMEKLLDSFEQFQKDLKIDSILFVQFPTWEPLCKILQEKYNSKIIFDCLDDFTSFGNVTNERKKEEISLISSGDLILTTSLHLQKKVVNITEKSLYLPNAGEFEHFNKTNDGILKYKKPIIGYFGSISDWFDTDLLEYIAKNRTQFTFVMIGHTFGSNILKLQKLPNVYFLGERPYSELPKYLQDFDVCLIPFKMTPLIEATHPIKIYEYFARGKPVVATNMPELHPISDMCYLAKDKADFLNKLDLAINEKDETIVEKRIKFASENTWEHRFETLYVELKKNNSFDIEHHN